MHTLTPQQAAANFMAAAAHLLVGAPGHHDALNANVSIIFGPPIDPINLLHWIDWVRRAGCPIIHFSFDDDQFTIPTVALVTITDGQARVFQNCALWMPEGGGGATLIPDSFEWGAYSIGADLTMEYQANPPVSDEPAGEPGFIRAYRRLLEIAHQQIEDGLPYALPERLQQRAA